MARVLDLCTVILPSVVWRVEPGGWSLEGGAWRVIFLNKKGVLLAVVVRTRMEQGSGEVVWIRVVWVV